MNAANIVVVLTFLATFNEAALELVLGRWHNPTVDRLTPLASIALGVGECVVLGINALSLVGITSQPLVGEIITGTVVGGGAAWVHRFFGKPGREGNEGNIL